EGFHRRALRSRAQTAQTPRKFSAVAGPIRQPRNGYHRQKIWQGRGMTEERKEERGFLSRWSRRKAEAREDAGKSSAEHAGNPIDEAFSEKELRVPQDSGIEPKDEAALPAHSRDEIETRL